MGLVLSGDPWGLGLFGLRLAILGVSRQLAEYALVLWSGLFPWLLSLWYTSSSEVSCSCT